MPGHAIEPRDPLVIRDGRPNDGRSQSQTLPFPYPSTVAGLCRARLGSEPGRGFTLDADQLPQLLATEIRGPLLVDQDSNGPVCDRVWVPAPRDALVSRVDERLHLRPLYRIAAEGARFDVEDGLEWMGQMPSDVLSGKPVREAPRFWSWSFYSSWLLGESARRSADRLDDLIPNGLSAFPTEARTHVALDENGVAEEGKLFGTAGLRLTAVSGRPLSLLTHVETPEGFDRGITPQVAPAAGERRLARWSESAAWDALDEIPAPVRSLVRAEGAESVCVRVTLLTPALFAQGWRPSASSPLLAGGLATLRSALVPRPEVVSGWDVRRQRPKPTRRMVSSGSVFVLELGGDPESRERWLESVWMKNLSDDAQDRRDGFGLGVVGAELKEEGVR